MAKWKEAPGFRNPGGRSRRRSVGFAGIALLAALLAACSTSSSSASGSSGSSGTSGSGGATASAPAHITGPVAPGTDVGLTKSTITVGLIADVNTSVAPGLFQKSVNAVDAWANLVNANGGLAGRKVVVNFCDSKLDPNATTNCVIQACQSDFALVGTSANALTDISDLDGCKNAESKAIGIPNLAAFAFPPLACDKVTYLDTGYGQYCSTSSSNPQTYSENIGDFRYYSSLYPNLHGIFVYDGDVPTLRIDMLPEFTAAANSGIKKDGQGFYTSSGAAPQSALTPLVQVLKQNQSTLGYGGATPANTVLLRKEAQIQGASSVKVWACNSGCYDSSFIQQGGSAVNNEYAMTYYLPFYTESQANPALKSLVSALGGVQNLNGNALDSYIMGLLFQDAVNKAIANGGTLDRQTLFAALNKETAFDAEGITGPANVAAHLPSACMVVSQVQNGQWQRVYPAKAGTFDCNPANLVTLKLNLSQG